MNTKKRVEKNCKNLKDKNILVVGSTGDLAKEFVKIFASLGANFVFANRNLEKTEKQIQELKSAYPNIKISVFKADMFDFESVKNLCKDLLKLKIDIDIVVLNAAIYNVPLKKSSLGYNNIFQVNFVSQFYLMKQLLPKLENQNNAKVIAIGSIAHNFSKLNENDIDFSDCKKCNKIYGNSKRFFMFSLYKLFENTKTKLSVVHPGITLTNMTNHYPKAINWLVKIGIKLVFPSPKNACLSVVLGTEISTKNNEWIGPSIFNIWGKPKKQKIKTCSEAEQNQIYKIANEIYLKIKNKK